MKGNSKDKSLIVGRKPVIDSIERDENLEKIWIEQGLSGPIEKQVRKYCKQKEIPLSVVHSRKLDRMSNTNHQGLIAQISLVHYHSVNDVVQLAYDKGEMPFLLLLDGVTDVRNMGAIARSAEIFGVHGMVVPIKNSAIINDLTMKTSAGALSVLPLCRVSSIIATLEEVKLMGLKTFAADMNAEMTVTDIPKNEPIAIVMGDEGEGVSQGVLDRIDHTFTIPQKGKTESLNVSVAAGVICYEISKG